MSGEGQFAEPGSEDVKQGKSQGPLLTECTSRAGLLPQKDTSHRVL